MLKVKLNRKRANPCLEELRVLFLNTLDKN